jgi:tetratricopeptide (TPR) repeat protein
MEPIRTEISEREKSLFGDETSRMDLVSVGFRNAGDLLAVFLASDREVDALCRNSALVTDATPVVEYFRRFGSTATGEELLRWLGHLPASQSAIWPGVSPRQWQQQAQLEAMIRRGDWMRSIPLLEYALSTDPDHLYLQRDLAVTPEQRAAAAQLRKSQPENPEYWDIEARIALRIQDLEYAGQILNEAVERFPEEGRFAVRLSDLYRKSARFTEAKQLLEQVMPNEQITLRLMLLELAAKTEPSPEEQLEMADLLYRIGDWTESARIYRNLMESNPEAAATGIARIKSAFRAN